MATVTVTKPQIVKPYYIRMKDMKEGDFAAIIGKGESNISSYNGTIIKRVTDKTFSIQDSKYWAIDQNTLEIEILPLGTKIEVIV